MLIGTSTLARPSAASICFGAIAAVVCALTMTLTALHSLTTSIDGWVAATYHDGASVRTGKPTGLDRDVILPATIDAIRGTPGVEDIAIFYNLYPSYQGVPILLGAVSADVLLRQGGLYAKDESPDQLVMGQDFPAARAASTRKRRRDRDRAHTESTGLLGFPRSPVSNPPTHRSGLRIGSCRRISRPRP